MNLKQFYDQLQKVIEYSVAKESDWENLEVVITTSGHSIGGRSKSKVKAIHRGIDWEHMQIRIEPVDELIAITTEIEECQ